MAGSKNEVYIAGGVVALGLAYYLFFADDAQAAPPPNKFPPAPTPTPNLPGPPTVFFSTRCPTIEAGLPDVNKKDVDDAIAAKLSSAEYGEMATIYMSQGWTKAAECLGAAQLDAFIREGVPIEKVPGGNAIDQTKTCAFWLAQYQHRKGQLEAAIASSFSNPPNPNAVQDINSATASMNAAKNAIAQLGGCGVVLP